jgi:hypothetical protein
LAVAANWRAKPFLALAVVLNLLNWVVGQGFGGIPQGGATDPNAGLLFVVLAYVMYTFIPSNARADAAAAGRHLDDRRHRHEDHQDGTDPRGQALHRAARERYAARWLRRGR